MSRRGWIGVDLDGTLAKYESGQGIGFVGEPIAPMVVRVKAWLDEGKEVRIMTARAYCSESGDPTEREQQREMIRAWCLKHLGVELKITCVKDYDMVELWDDRAVQVIKNTGEVVEEQLARLSADYQALRQATGRAPHDYEPARPGLSEVD